MGSWDVPLTTFCVIRCCSKAGLSYWVDRDKKMSLKADNRMVKVDTAAESNKDRGLPLLLGAKTGPPARQSLKVCKNVGCNVMKAIIAILICDDFSEMMNEHKQSRINEF